MLLGGGHQLIGEHVREAGQPLEVSGREFDGEQVGDEGAPMADCCSPVIHGAAHGRSDLHGLDLGFESLGEDTMNRSFESSLDAIEHSHSRSFLSVGLSIVTGQTGSARMPLPLEPTFCMWTPDRFGFLGGRPPHCVSAREWRNGRRAGFRCQCPRGRGGSNPPSRTVK